MGMIVRVPPGGPIPPPVLYTICPPTQNIQVLEPTTCTSVDLPEPQIYGGVPPFKIEYNPADLSQFCVGTSPVLCMVTDAIDQISLCNFDVVVTQIPLPPPTAIFAMDMSAGAVPLAGYDGISGPGELGIVVNRTYLPTGGPSGQPAYDFDHIYSAAQDNPANGWGGEYYVGWGVTRGGIPAAGESRFLRFRFRIRPDANFGAIDSQDGSQVLTQHKLFILADGGTTRTILSVHGWPGNTFEMQLGRNGEGNIHTGNILLPGVWYHVQTETNISSPNGYLRLWINNNNFASPNFQATGISFLPANYNFLGFGYYNNRMTSATGIYGLRMLDAIYDDAFDNTWAP